MSTQLSDVEAAAYVEGLKREADRHWWINAHRSLELADEIVHVGQARGDRGFMALGMMARGDALKFLGRVADAWDALDEAGRLYLAADDEIGWARTRIGRLTICVERDRVSEALDDAERAREILTRRDMPEKLLRLDLNTAIVHSWLGNQARALALYQAALARAEVLGAEGETFLAGVYASLGFVYEAQGNLRDALDAYEQASTLSRARGETRGEALAQANIACILLAQGQYRSALGLFYRARECYAADALDLDIANVNRDIVEAYLHLNRFSDARALAYDVIATYRASGSTFLEARTLLHLASAEARLGDLHAAYAALDTATALFESRKAASPLAVAHLWRARIALARGELPLAGVETRAAEAGFAACGEDVNEAQARLLRGQVEMARGRLPAAKRIALRALQIAQQRNVFAIRYAAHVLLGRIAQAHNDSALATRRYQAATATIDRAHRSLTISLRPGFLEDKGEAQHALIALHLADGRVESALESLEHVKAQALFTYLANRELLRWATDEPESQAQIAELERLRAEHHWWYRRAHDSIWKDDEIRSGEVNDREHALAEIAVRERRMRAITERLYLSNGARLPLRGIDLPRAAALQRHLDDRTLLIEYYDDTAHLWAYSVDTRGMRVDPLPATMAAIIQLTTQLELNMAAALATGRDNPATRRLAHLGTQIARRLYATLLEPIAARIEGWERLVIVPYGALHYLPFHLLHDGSGYLIQTREIVILPTAALLTRQAPIRAKGARVLAYDHEGMLPTAEDEGRRVQRLMGGTFVRSAAANRGALRATPRQVLHLAAHGEQRLDQPDLSYVQLADGLLFADDLFQLDLSYELVTMSACETGCAVVAGGDELLGLGRGFLYAGAGALIASMWRVPDAETADLMAYLYGELKQGQSKAAALRAAQLAMLERTPNLHPAFWGAFQLIGNAEPLTAAVRAR